MQAYLDLDMPQTVHQVLVSQVRVFGNLSSRDGAKLCQEPICYALESAARQRSAVIT